MVEERRGFQQCVVATGDADDRGRLITARLVQFADVGDEVDAVLVRRQELPAVGVLVVVVTDVVDHQHALRPAAHRGQHSA